MMDHAPGEDGRDGARPSNPEGKGVLFRNGATLSSSSSSSSSSDLSGLFEYEDDDEDERGIL
jgi:hypothetical protein